MVEKLSTHKQVDAVVFLRPDVMYISELPVFLFSHYQGVLFVPDFQRSCAGMEYNDRMAMGDLKSAVIYGKKFDGALNYSLRHPLHSEKFTYDYLHANRVRVIEIPFRFRRMRAKGMIHDRFYNYKLILILENLSL